MNLIDFDWLIFFGGVKTTNQFWAFCSPVSFGVFLPAEDVPRAVWRSQCMMDVDPVRPRVKRQRGWNGGPRMLERVGPPYSNRPWFMGYYWGGPISAKAKAPWFCVFNIRCLHFYPLLILTVDSILQYRIGWRETLANPLWQSVTFHQPNDTTALCVSEWDALKLRWLRMMILINSGW